MRVETGTVHFDTVYGPYHDESPGGTYLLPVKRQWTLSPTTVEGQPAIQVEDRGILVERDDRTRSWKLVDKVDTSNPDISTTHGIWKDAETHHWPQPRGFFATYQPPPVVDRPKDGKIQDNEVESLKSKCSDICQEHALDLKPGEFPGPAFNGCAVPKLVVHQSPTGAVALLEEHLTWEEAFIPNDGG